MEWHWGRYTFVTNAGLEPTTDRPADAEFWVCPRYDEPETWRYRDGQQKALCAGCGTMIVYLVAPHAPGPTVPKVCTRCAMKLVEQVKTNDRSFLDRIVKKAL